MPDEVWRDARRDPKLPVLVGDLQRRIETLERQLASTRSDYATKQYVDDLTDDAGWNFAGFVLAAGFSSPAGCKYRIIHGVAYVVIRMTRTGAALTASATGGLTDTDVVTVPSAIIPDTTYYANFKSSASGGTALLESNTGLIKLADLHSGSSCATNDTLNCTFIYPLGAG